jgi:uncharacterized RDD family membrane protein YckC
VTGIERNAGFWRRAAAFGVDALWLFCTAGTLALALSGTPWPSAGDGTGLAGAAAVLLNRVLPALVCIVGWGRFGATPGKCLLELRVVDARTGGRPGYMRAFIRYVGYFVSFLTLGLGFVWIVFDRRRQGLHDKLAGTRVIRVAADEEILGIDPASVA